MNFIAYTGNNQLMVGDENMHEKMGGGFKEGEKVTVQVNMETGEVVWTVNEKKEADYKWKKLKNTSINWVPYLDMGSGGDIVEMID